METPTKLTVTVKPGSKKGPLVTRNEMGELTVYVRERAVEGQANEAIIRLLADYFNVPKTSIQITHGHKSRIKLVNYVSVVQRHDEPAKLQR